MPVRLLHLGDLHLGWNSERLGDQAGERAEEFAQALLRAIDFALEPDRRIDAVLMTGDQFETRAPQKRELDFFRAQLQRLADANKPAVMIPGTHDGYFYTDCVYRHEEFPSAHIITRPNIDEPLTLDINGEKVYFYGMAYSPARSKKPFDEFQRKDLPGVHVALIHGSVVLNPEWDDGSLEAPLRIELLLQSRMHYIALGHYHSFRQWDGEQCVAAYCGSLERKKARDSAPRVLVVAELDGKGARIETHPFDAREVIERQIDLTALDDLSAEALADRLCEELPEGCIAKVALEGSVETPLPLADVQEYLSERCFHLELDDQTLVWQSGQLEQWSQEPTIRGAFIKRMKKRIEPAKPEEVAPLNLALKLALAEFMRSEENE
ncbi:DNA repair exonuclease [Candidatus Sumerlaeota bacterium]|nr:DNA repair exonuclease [Candidatus Sumerlaeota bacterium]